MEADLVIVVQHLDVAEEELEIAAAEGVVKVLEPRLWPLGSLEAAPTAGRRIQIET